MVGIRVVCLLAICRSEKGIVSASNFYCSALQVDVSAFCQGVIDQLDSLCQKMAKHLEERGKKMAEDSLVCNGMCCRGCLAGGPHSCQLVASHISRSSLKVSGVS